MNKNWTDNKTLIKEEKEAKIKVIVSKFILSLFLILIIVVAVLAQDILVLLGFLFGVFCYAGTIQLQNNEDKIKHIKSIRECEEKFDKMCGYYNKHSNN